MAYQKGDGNTMDDEIKWLSAQILMASEQVENDGIALCATGTSRYSPTENSINSAEAVIAQIQGMQAMMEGDQDQFERYMKKAVKLEDETNYPSGPPRITMPSFEQYGDWLLKQRKYSAAIEQYNKALHRMPRRSKSLIGKMQALKALGQQNEADIVREELISILGKADKKVLDVI
jgi:tetratricopeptide (TPR) repeat protein